MNLLILIADESRARAFACDGRNSPLREIEAFIHPKGRLKDQQIVTDRPGRVRTGLGGRAVTAMSPHTDPKQVEAEHFAAELANLMGRALEHGEFELLALIAPPRFLGLLRDKLSEPVRRRLVASAARELTLLEARDLPAHLSEVLNAAEQASLALRSAR
jgi:protein required for attachment to host cells